jgi:CRP-like cAMP-binding protein
MNIELDTGTTITVEKLTRGAVIGAHKMLISDLNSVTAICTTHVIIYTIERKLFTELCTRDSQLMLKLIKLQDELLDKDMEERTLDFV